MKLIMKNISETFDSIYDYLMSNSSYKGSGSEFVISLLIGIGFSLLLIIGVSFPSESQKRASRNFDQILEASHQTNFWKLGSDEDQLDKK